MIRPTGGLLMSVYPSVHPAAMLGQRPGESGNCLNLFNGPSVISGGMRTEVPEGGKRVLAFVALSSGVVERRRAAGALWPDGDEVRAAGSLRSALWRLKCAGIDLVQADKVALRLRPGTTVDVDQLVTWSDRVMTGVPTAADLRISRWHIDFLELLPGWYEDWVIFERERLRQRLLHALEALARLLVDHDRIAEAIEVAMIAISAEPLRESAQRVLIEAHLAEGNMVEANRAFYAFRALALRELGVEPGNGLRSLIDQRKGRLARGYQHALTRRH
ncbi:BTAD domain-containing putative transcriptional regulator [Actinoplanes sp. NPDC026619]|uniref:AfsR/SARP family transcriptional regulator n=1 Tax=Actinoplanes sp. NPDC026619 TaxID=3155798 RepID=UPI0033FEFFBB